MKFYRCTNCDQVYMILKDSQKPMTCCELETIKLSENENKDESESHKPHIRKVGNFVTMTLPNHPMIDVHHLDFICLETNKGFQFKSLENQELPKAEFILSKGEEIVNVYVYCNVHSLWSLNESKE